MPGPALAGIIGAVAPEVANTLGLGGAAEGAGAAAKTKGVKPEGGGDAAAKKVSGEALKTAQASMDKSVDQAWAGLNGEVEKSRGAMANPKSSAPEKDNGAFAATMDSAGAKPA
ncbi:MAG: hypothetical protein HYU97_01995 [Deltaproteobacteria bacterium]|nr:hypothetical protein [Deltaproteobacteria bacterium]